MAGIFAGHFYFTNTVYPNKWRERQKIFGIICRIAYWDRENSDNDVKQCTPLHLVLSAYFCEICGKTAFLLHLKICCL
jgi:hypothetical protein